jgi:hypothetical protein
MLADGVVPLGRGPATTLPVMHENRSWRRRRPNRPPCSVFGPTAVRSSLRPFPVAARRAIRPPPPPQTE